MENICRVIIPVISLTWNPAEKVMTGRGKVSSDIELKGQHPGTIAMYWRDYTNTVSGW